MKKEMQDKKPIYSGLRLLKMLKPIIFKWKAPLNDGRHHFGFKAQDVAEILPRQDYGIVNVNKGYLTLDYKQIIPILAKAVQELDEKNTKLEKKIKEMEEQNNASKISNSHS